MRRLVVVLLTIACFFVARGAAAQGGEIVVDRIMARVNDAIITRSDLVRAFPIYLQVATRVDPGTLRTKEGQEKVAEDLLNYLIDTELLTERAKSQDMALSKTDVTEYLKNYRDSLGMTQAQFREALSKDGVNFDDYKRFMRDYLTRMQVLRAEAIDDVKVTDDEVQKAIKEQYPDGFVQPYFTTSHIFIKLPENATQEQVERTYDRLQTLRKEIVSGQKTFEDVATNLNSDGTRARGGLVGSFTLGELDPDYTRAALGLKPGEISQPVRSRYGMHLIRLESIEDKEVADKDQVKKRIRYQLHQKKTDRKEDAFLKRLRKKAFVEIVSKDFGI